MKPENSQIEMRERLRDIREGTLGSYEKAAFAMGFNKNTVASYEKGQTLPDIDYLFVFADRTGADINELIRLRLACSKYESARALVTKSNAQIEIERIEQKMMDEQRLQELKVQEATVGFVAPAARVESEASKGKPAQVAKININALAHAYAVTLQTAPKGETLAETALKAVAFYQYCWDQGLITEDGEGPGNLKSTA